MVKELLPRGPSQQGFHKTFGQGRGAKRDLFQRDNQQSTRENGQDCKRARITDRPDERGPVGQRDRLEGSNPTTLVSNRHRNPENPKLHPLGQSSNPLASHVSSVSLKLLLDLISERVPCFKARNEASKCHKRALEYQERNHYRPSDYGSSPGFYTNQERESLEEMQRADKSMKEFDERIAAALHPLLQHISEAWAKNPDASKALEERTASEANLNTIKETMTKQIEDSIKKEVTESRQLIKELVGSQTVKLKEALAQDNEQKLHALQKTLAQEAEDRATSLRKTLVQDSEKRVAEMKDAINREDKARAAALENALFEEAKTKTRVAALENTLSKEAKNKNRITALERASSEEAKNKERITALEKVLSEEAKNKDRIAALERALSEDAKNKDRITALERASSEEAKNKDRIAALERALSEDAKNKDKITALERALSEEAKNRDRIAALERALSEEAKNKDRITALERTLSEDAKNKDRIAALERALSEEAKNRDRIAALERALSEEAKNRDRITALERALSEEAKNRDRIAALERTSSEEAKNKDRITALEMISSEEAKNKNRITALERALSEEAKNKDRITALEKSLSETGEKNTGLDQKVTRLESRADQAAADQQLLANSLMDKSQLTLLDDGIAKVEARLEIALSEQRMLSEACISKAELDQQLQQHLLSQDEKFEKLEARVNRLPDYSPRIKELAQQIYHNSNLIQDSDQQQGKTNIRLDYLESASSKILEKEEEMKELVQKQQGQANVRLDSLEVTLSEILEEGEEMKERFQKLSSNKPASVSNDNILEVLRPELAKNAKDTKEMIVQIHNKLRPFLEQEREKRETLQEQIGDFARQISEIQKENTATKTDYSDLKGNVNGQTDEIKRLEESIGTRIGLIMDEFKAQMEAVHIQVQTINAWQTNFNTQGLYRDMVNHINRTTPEGPGAVPQIRALKQQVSGIETRIAAWENGSNKKRKLIGGNGRVVNGHQTDA